MRKAMAFTFGAIMGGVIGALVAMLMAPSSGEELRASIQKQIEDIQSEITEAAQKKRAELEEQLDELIHPKES
jgi:gas vesicle protein